MQLLFSSEETGADNIFSVTSYTQSDPDDDTTRVTTKEFEEGVEGGQKTIKEGRDAVIWMGEKDSGIKLTNSTRA